MYVRQCNFCGTRDLRERYETIAKAVACGVREEKWLCRTCGHRRFSLVDRDHEQTQRSNISGES